MEKTQNILPLFPEGTTALPEKLFDLQELLENLGINPSQLEKANYLLSLQGLSDYEIRQKLKNAPFILTGNFGLNSCLYYLYFIFCNGCCLCLFNGDEECFNAYFFQREHFPQKQVKSDGVAV